jgi:hypothetical protein
MNWKDLTEAVGRRVYQIEMADGFISLQESNRRWNYMKDQHSGPRVQIERYVGSTLIALEEMHLIELDKELQ